MNVDIIEAGFPITSKGDFEAVSAVAKEVKGPVIAALARTIQKDIDVAWEAVKDAERPRIHTFISTSDVHLKHMLRRTQDEALEMAVKAVRYAAKYTPDVEFSAQDATRTDTDFLVKIFTAAIKAGATTINIPDTVGYTTPGEFYKLITDIMSKVPNIDKVVVSVHCHNDLGLAVANSLAALQAGARQIECTVNGIGERAGNTALEEIVMITRTRRDYYGIESNVITNNIYKISRLVAALTGMRVQPNKAIVGANAFAHESGIHQAGVLKERSTYEIIRTEDIGLPSGKMVLGKHSGRHAVRERLFAMGYSFTDEELDKAFQKFKDLADRKKDITDQDLAALMEQEMLPVPELYKLVEFQVTSGNKMTATGMVKMASQTGEVTEAAFGEGPINALYRAVDRTVGVSHKLLDYSLQAVTGGKDALGEVTVKVERDNKVYIGRGVSPDILEASVLAYIGAINKGL